MVNYSKWNKVEVSSDSEDEELERRRAAMRRIEEAERDALRETVGGGIDLLEERVIGVGISLASFTRAVNFFFFKTRWRCTAGCGVFA